MLRLLGAVLVVGGAGALGLLAAQKLRRRVENLRAMTGALELAERELSFRLPPIPDLFSSLERRAPAPAGACFGRCLAGMDRLGEDSLGTLWREAVEETLPDLAPEDREELAELGEVLGRYDGEGQRQALALTRARLERNLERAEADRDSRGRLCAALGLTAGAFGAILLL